MKNTISPQMFGPGVWFTIHEMALKVGENKCYLEYFNDLINFLSKHLPCGKCRSNFKKLMNSKVDCYGSKVKLSELSSCQTFVWSWSIHNQVNATIHKQMPPCDVMSRIYTSGKFTGDDYKYVDKSPFVGIDVGCDWLLKATKDKNYDLFCVIYGIYKSINASQWFNPDCPLRPVIC